MSSLACRAVWHARVLSSGILNDRWHAISKYGLSLNARADYRIKCESTTRARAFMYASLRRAELSVCGGRDDSVYWDAVCKPRLLAFSWLTHRSPPPLNRDSPRIWSTMKIAFAGKTDYLKIIDFRPTPSLSPFSASPFARQVRWREKGIRRRISDSSFGSSPRTEVILLLPWVVNVNARNSEEEEEGRFFVVYPVAQVVCPRTKTAFPIFCFLRNGILRMVGLVTYSTFKQKRNFLRHVHSQ